MTIVSTRCLVPVMEMVPVYWQDCTEHSRYLLLGQNVGSFSIKTVGTYNYRCAVQIFKMPLASGPPSGRQEVSNALKALFRVLLSLA